MAVTPTGILHLPQLYLRDTLAASAAFRTWCGAASVAAAKARIYLGAVTPPTDGETYTATELATLHPYALIWTPDDGGFSRTAAAMSAAYEFTDRGRVGCQLAQLVGTTLSEADANATFQNFLGTLFDELAALSGQAGYLAWHTLDILAGPIRDRLDHAPDGYERMGIELAFTWGSQA